MALGSTTGDWDRRFNLWARVARESSSAEADASNVARVLFDVFEVGGALGNVIGLGIVIWTCSPLFLIS